MIIITIIINIIVTIVNVVITEEASHLPFISHFGTTACFSRLQHALK